MKKKFGILLFLLTIPSVAIPSCFISSCSNDGVYIKSSGTNCAEFDTQSNTLKIINDYYNPVQTEKHYYSWLNLDAVHKLDDHIGYSIKEWTLNLSNVPTDLKDKIKIETEGFQCWIYFEQSANILEWDEFKITVNYVTGLDYAGSGVKGSYTFNVAAQKEGWVDKYTLGPLTGAGNQNYSAYALTGFHDTAGNCHGILTHNVEILELISDSRVHYLYDNFMNFLESKQIEAPQMSGGVFGDLHRSYGDPEIDYKIKNEDDQKLWDWNFGTVESPTSGRWNKLIIDDYDNNPNWKEDGYKTLQIGNPYTWRSWNKMFYKCYSLLPSLHYYFDNFTNEVPIAKDGSSTGEPGTPTETYRFTPEDVDAMVYGY